MLGRGSNDACEAIAHRLAAATGGFVLTCARDDAERLCLIVAVPGARRHEVARDALARVTDVLRRLDVDAVDLTLIDPGDATVELKHQLTAAPV